MPRELIHIYGPLSIQSYGLAIVIAIFVFTASVLRDRKRPTLIDSDRFMSLMVYGIIAGAVGGRLLWILSNMHEISHLLEVASIWEGGLSVLGSIIGILCMLPWYLSYHKIPLVPFLDLIAVYAPLLQSIARLGCFFAGCCYGKLCSHAWAITYTDATTFAPLNQALHPTQLYSALALLLLFLVLYFYARHQFTSPGALFSLYLAGAGCERFIVDFFRADQEWLTTGFRLFSLHQCIALGLICFALTFYSLSSWLPSHKQGSPRHE